MLVSELYCRYIIYPLEEEVKRQRRAIYTCRSLKKERKNKKGCRVFTHSANSETHNPCEASLWEACDADRASWPLVSLRSDALSLSIYIFMGTAKTQSTEFLSSLSRFE